MAWLAGIAIYLVLLSGVLVLAGRVRRGEELNEQLMRGLVHADSTAPQRARAVGR